MFKKYNRINIAQVINSLGMDTHMHTHILTFLTKVILINQACISLQLACAWLKIVKLLYTATLLEFEPISTLHFGLG